jgi:hypothetical protein
MRKNLLSDSKNKIEKFLESNKKIIKNLFKTTKSNHGPKNMRLSHSKEIILKLAKPTKEAVFMKDLTNHKDLIEIVTESHSAIPNI